MRNVVIVAGGTATGQALAILVSPILTRLYSPDDFGVLSVYSAILNTLLAIVSLRYEMAIPLPVKDEDAINLVALAFGISLLVSSVTGIVIGIYGYQLAVWVNVPKLQPYLWLLPFGLFVTGIYQMLSYWAIRKKAFQGLAKTKLNQSFSQSIVQIGLGLLKVGPVGLLLGHLSGQSGGIGTLSTSLFGGKHDLIAGVSWRGVRRVAERYKRFPIILSWSALFNTLGQQLPALLLATFYGLDVAGWFAVSERVSRAPARLVGMAIAQVYLGEAANLIKENPAGLERTFASITWKLLLFGGIPILVIGTASPWVFPIIFGSEWYQAGKILQLMSLSVAAQFVVAPLSQTAILFERQDLQMWGDVTRMVIVSAVLYISYFSQQSYYVAILLYSCSMLATYVVFYMIYRGILSKQTRIRRQQLSSE